MIEAMMELEGVEATAAGTLPELAGGTPTPLQRFTARLGEDVFFVPCEWGTKKPLVTYVERPFEGTKTPAYRALFEVEPANIAVYLGKASGGLCAIDFDADEDLAAFLAVNPKLAGDNAVARQPRRHGLGADRGRLPGELQPGAQAL